jgi:hypothetical protein
MSILINEKIKLPSILKVKFTRENMKLDLSDGRILIIPLAWYSKLATASKKQLLNFNISPSGYGIHWSDIDEDLSIYGFLFPNK